MTTVTPLPTPVPSRQDPANFATRADEFLSALPTFGTELNLVAGEVNTNASDASTAATTATTQAGIATNAANTATTQAGIATTAATNADTSRSQSETAALAAEGYRDEAALSALSASNDAAATAALLDSIAGGPVASINGETGVVTLDASDVGAAPAFTDTTTTVSKTLSNMERCSVTASGKTITLPATPANGWEVTVMVGDFVDTIINRNGQTIMGISENMTIDKPNVGVTFLFASTWRII